MLLTPEHRAYLLAAAIRPQVLDASGITSTRPGPGTVPGILFPWSGPGSDTPLMQFRPDAPGDGAKYVQGAGVRLPFNCLRDDDPESPVLIVEGTKQSYAALSWAPSQYAVYGLAGCWNWSGLPLGFAEDRDVSVLFDGDMASNADVHRAAKELGTALELAGAVSVSWVLTGAQGKDGVDDVLAALPGDPARLKAMTRWLGKARQSVGKPPPAKRTNRFFGKEGLMVRVLAKDILDHQPAALTAEGAVALYRDGVYRSLGDLPLISEVEERLEDQHRSTHMTSAKQAIQAHLYRQGKRLPEKMAEPLANFTNGMLDLRSGALLPHDPAHLSRVQHPVAWDPAAPCPAYEAWLKSVLPDQMDDIEEVAGSLLDPSRTPAKALFAYGPSHTGKSTFIRLLMAVAGHENASAVTLHDLAEDRFAAANVYGMALNAAPDLSSRDVSDLSLFKMMTGEDPIQANRKYGPQFQFTSAALFAFGANELPSVGEASRAYVNRMKPFHFDRSFEGREDPGVETAMIRELPGITRRWALAYNRFLARGAYLPTHPPVAAAFDTGSDRVRMWAATAMRVTRLPSGLPPGSEPVVDSASASSATALHVLFNQWAQSNGGKPLGKIKLMERLTSINGVRRVRVAPSKSRALNLVPVTDSD